MPTIGVVEAVTKLQAAVPFVKTTEAYAKIGWEYSQNLTREYKTIYDKFTLGTTTPNSNGGLVEIFADEEGFKTLMQSTDKMQLLVQVIKDLLASSKTLNETSRAFTSIVGKQLYLNTYLNGTLGDIPDTNPEGKNLVADMNFDEMAKSLLNFSDRANSFATTMGYIDVSYGPLMEHVEATLGSMEGAGGYRRLKDDTSYNLRGVGRRLSDWWGTVQRDAEMYANATKLIVPTWKGVEQLSTELCPWAKISGTSSASVRCRVEGFISTDGAETSVSTTVDACTAESASAITAVSTSVGGDGTCPTVSKAAGIVDSMSQYSEEIGLGLALYAHTPWWVYALIALLILLVLLLWAWIIYKFFYSATFEEDGDLRCIPSSDDDAPCGLTCLKHAKPFVRPPPGGDTNDNDAPFDDSNDNDGPDDSNDNDQQPLMEDSNDNDGPMDTNDNDGPTDSNEND